MSLDYVLAIQNLLSLSINKGYIKYGRKKIDSLSNDTKINSISEEVFYVSSDYREYLFNINIKEDFIYYVGNKEEDSLIDILKTFNLDKRITDTAKTVLVNKTNPSGIILINAATVFITALLKLLSKLY